MFVPGRSRRERPIGGLGSGVRAFVRSVLRLKVWDSEIPRVFAELASVTEDSRCGWEGKRKLSR